MFVEVKSTDYLKQSYAWIYKYSLQNNDVYVIWIKKYHSAVKKTHLKAIGGVQNNFNALGYRGVAVLTKIA